MSDKFNKAKYIRNENVMRPRYYFGDKFAYDTGAGNVWDSGTLDYDTCVKTIEHHKLGNNSNVRCPQGAREWGYHFFCPKTCLSGDGARYGKDGFEVEPKDRKEALEMLKEGIFDLYDLGSMSDWETCPGHFPWQHYACEWGCTSVCAEVGESISFTQAHASFNRGCSRQYNIPWALQFSFWHWGRINDYTGDAIWGGRQLSMNSRINGGHSPQLYKRIALLTYLGGGSHFYPEAGLVINFTKEKTADGIYRLSPIGKMTKKLNEFITRSPDIGTSYSLFGVVLDKYHGMFTGSRRIKPKKAFQVFDYTDGDDMTFNILDMFFPASFNHFISNEASYMVNGPAGETVDVLLQGASSEVINAYPCIILTGDIKLSDEEKEMYKSYTLNGGTLILNTEYLEFFPEYKERYNGRLRCDLNEGDGKVIIYGPTFDIHVLPSIIKEQVARFIPFKLSEQVDFMLNVKDSSLILTLMNNSGYYYNFDSGEDIDYSETKSLKITYTGDGVIKAITELWEDKKLEPEKEINLTLAPAEVKIFEFEF